LLPNLPLAVRAIAASDLAEMMRRAVAFTRFATSFTCARSQHYPR